MTDRMAIRTFPTAFKLKAIKRAEGVAPIGGTDSKGTRRRTGPGASEDRRARAQDRTTGARYRFFSKSLARLGRSGSARLNRARLTEVIEAMIASDVGKVDVQHFCKLAGVSRASYYRRFQARAPREADVELTSRIQLLSLRHKFYGYRRITAVLRRSGMVINAKRVQRLIIPIAACNMPRPIIGSGSPTMTLPPA